MPSVSYRPSRGVAGLAAAAALLAFACYPLGQRAALAAFLAAVLVVLAASDILTLRIPNRILVPATAVVLGTRICFSSSRLPVFLLAGLVASAMLLLPHLIDRAYMGMGDVKLGLMLGFALGWGVVGALILAFMLVLPVAVAMLIRQGGSARTAALPFGPFMALGALIMLIGPQLA